MQKGSSAARVVMADGVHVGTCAVDRGVDRPLRRRPRGRGVARAAREIDFDEVGTRHQPRRAHARDDEAVGAIGMARAHVAESVEHALRGEDAAGEDEVVEHGGGCGSRCHAAY